MHARKTLMAELADAFIALPGGYGTFDELCEMLTWNQLGIHAKPVVLVNLDGFFDGFLAQLDRAVADRLLTPANRAMLCVVARRRGRARRRAPLAAAACGAEVVSRSGARTMSRLKPLAELDRDALAQVRGVLADIDDTITTRRTPHGGRVRGARKRCTRRD